MEKSKFSQHFYIINVLGRSSLGGGMKENKHSVIFMCYGIQALNTKGCDTTCFSIIHRRVIIMFRITRLSSKKKNSVGHRLLYALYKPHTVEQQPEGDRRKTGRWKNFMQEITALTTEHVGSAAAQKYEGTYKLTEIFPASD